MATLHFEWSGFDPRSNEGIKYAKARPSEAVAAANILVDAMKAPLTQILANAGLNIENIYMNNEQEGFGYNLKTGEMGDLIKIGVIDPLKVTRSALQNAVSVAITIMSTNAIITMARTFEPSEPQTLANTYEEYNGR